MDASYTYDFDMDGKCPQLDFPENEQSPSRCETILC